MDEIKGNKRDLLGDEGLINMLNNIAASRLVVVQGIEQFYGIGINQICALPFINGQAY